MIVPVVEGHSEVEAVPVLMRRLRDAQGAFEVQIGKPIRVPRYKVVKEGEIERAVALAKTQYPGVRAIMFVLDADDDCPKLLAPGLLKRAQQAAGSHVICSIVLPKSELESWFVASILSLRSQRGIRQDAIPPEEPEGISDAKGWLTATMRHRTYIETDDQPAFAQQFNLAQALERCPSFRKFCRDFSRILEGYSQP